MPQNSLSVQIPDKLFFKIGEVSDIADVPAYVLRFWDTEFKKIKPKRTPTGQRLYRKKDVELVLKIKHLLYDEKFTIQGAKKHLGSKNADNSKKVVGKKAPISLEEIRLELLQLRDMLS